MKKILLFAATATMLFAACTNEDLVAPQTGAETTLEDGAVGFDVYLPGATAQTRAGRAGVMTTGTLQKTGFGIFAYQTQTDNAGYTTGKHVPDYMWNQQVFYNSAASGWYYTPLKYWPNETKNDSQTNPKNPAAMPNQTSPANIDRLTFFAYAPWVMATDAHKTQIVNPETEVTDANIGIQGVTNKHGDVWQGGNPYASSADAMIAYQSAFDPNESVDLLWGVAPAGGLSYTSVAKSVTDGTGGTISNGVVTIAEGMPLANLIKPAVNTNIKFMFQHALARIGVQVVAAVDQVAAGGVFDYGNTKITIEKIEIGGPFGTNGILNLMNTNAFVANWVKKNTADGEPGNPKLVLDRTHGLAEHLRYNWKDGAVYNFADHGEQQKVTGVTTKVADAIQVSSKYDANYPDDYVTSVSKVAYSATTPYFAGKDKPHTPTYATYAVWKKTNNTTTYLHKFVTNNGVSYTDITGVINTQYPNATVWEEIYSIADDKIHLVADGEKTTYSGKTAYRKVGKTYTETGRKVEEGDYVFLEDPTTVPVPQIAESKSYYLAKPNYFMVIPTNSDAETDRTLKVKITYYVSTTDASLKNGIVYTKNEVEKDVVLPHLKNGVAYNLKLILGLTSVKVEAEVADWVTTDAEVNLPQNISE